MLMAAVAVAYFTALFLGVCLGGQGVDAPTHLESNDPSRLGVAFVYEILYAQLNKIDFWERGPIETETIEGTN